MCLTTLYDSPTCGHTWLSLSTPCSFLSDLLSCPVRSTYQTLIAPPYICPMCNGGFANPETIEMVQGPWGCNQLIRGHVGGNYAIPGQWGNVPLSVGSGWGMGGIGGPALTSGYTSGYGSATAGPMMSCGNGFTYDHRLTGPYGPGEMGGGAPLMLTNGPAVVYDDYGGFDRGGCFDDGCFDGGYLLDDYSWGGGCGRREKKSRHKSKYKYRYTDRPATNCVVM